MEESNLVPSPESSKEVEKTSSSGRGRISEVPGLGRLERLAEKRFTEEKIIDMIADLCEAKDLRPSKDGLVSTPNWSAREAGLVHAMRVRRFIRKNDPVSGDGMPVRLTLNVINPQITVPPKEVKSDGA